MQIMFAGMKMNYAKRGLDQITTMVTKSKASQ